METKIETIQQNARNWWIFMIQASITPTLPSSAFHGTEAWNQDTGFQCGPVSTCTLTFDQQKFFIFLFHDAQEIDDLEVRRQAHSSSKWIHCYYLQVSFAPKRLQRACRLGFLKAAGCWDPIPLVRSWLYKGRAPRTVSTWLTPIEWPNMDWPSQGQMLARNLKVDLTKARGSDSESKYIAWLGRFGLTWYTIVKTGPRRTLETSHVAPLILRGEVPVVGARCVDGRGVLSYFYIFLR